MPILESFPPQLECDVIVFRVLKPSWFDGSEILSTAFILAERNGAYETGISVLNNLENAQKPIARPKAITTLLVGKMRDIGLNVIPDAEINPFFDPNRIVHGQIVGMPPPDTDENRLIAERVATQIMETIKGRPFIWQRPQPAQ